MKKYIYIATLKIYTYTLLRVSRVDIVKIRGYDKRPFVHGLQVDILYACKSPKVKETQCRKCVFQ